LRNQPSLTMTVGAALPPPIMKPVSQDPYHPMYGFQRDDWITPPTPDVPTGFPDEEHFRRAANANAYRQHGNPTTWHTYITLGFFAFDDCSSFERIWKRFDADPLTVHRVIWYQFMYYVDREMPIPEKLNAWAMDITHAYLEYHDASSLEMDSFIQWKSLPFNTPMDMEPTDEWIPVTPNRRGRNKSPSATTNVSKSTDSTIPKTTIPARTHEEMKRNPYKKPKQSTTNDQLRHNKVAKPTSMPLEVETVHDDETEDSNIEAGVVPTDSENLSVPMSYATTRTSTFPMIAVNDGTHRITIKWTVSGGIQQLERDRHKLKEAIHQILTSIFKEEDGLLHRWQHHTMPPTSITTLSSSEVHNYINPDISLLKSSSRVIFSVRFAFTDNPVVWQTKAVTKQSIKADSLELLISNAESTSGKILTVGYILLKAPNTTSAHRYTQFLRSQLPEDTPFFDVIRYRKTPMDQLIPYLVVQCGELNVTLVSQALLEIMTGNGIALFLPRYAFSVLTDDQVRSQFLAHEKWARSLTALNLAPHVFHLDQKRTEHNKDGTTIERSTREWAATLTLSDGSPALCDVVNGTSEKKAYLLAPSYFVDQARAHLQEYRLRISPPSRREARYRNYLQDLPDIIHIKTAISPNVSFMEKLMDGDIWQQPMSSTTRKDQDIPGTTNPKEVWESTSKVMSEQAQPRNAWFPQPTEALDQPTLRGRQGKEQSLSKPQQDAKKKLVELEEQSTASTHSITQASELQYQTRMQELEMVTKNKLQALAATSRESAERLKKLENQFSRLDQMDKTMAAVQDQIHSVTRQLEESATSQRGISYNLKVFQEKPQKQVDEIGSHLLTAVENVNTLTGAMSEIKLEFTKLSQLMQDMADRQLANESIYKSINLSIHSHGVRSKITDSTTHPLQGTDACDHSIASSQSKQSYDSKATHSTSESLQSSASVTIRSPPPKRTRQGVILDPDCDPMNLSPDERSTSTMEALHEDGNASAVDPANTPINLAGRFNEESMDLPNHCGGLRVTSDTPSLLTAEQDLNIIRSQELHQHAPLDPSYNLSMTDPAGAVTE
jgi:hypothetical protein